MFTRYVIVDTLNNDRFIGTARECAEHLGMKSSIGVSKIQWYNNQKLLYLFRYRIFKETEKDEIDY